MVIASKAPEQFLESTGNVISSIMAIYGFGCGSKLPKVDVFRREE